MFLINQTKFILVSIVTLILGVNMTSSGQCNFTQGPIGELCSSAIYICGSELDGYTSRLPENLSATQQWPVLCGGNGTADNIIWFSFTPCTQTVTLEIIPGNCTTENGTYSGLQAGLFDSCNKNGSVACTDHSNNNGITTTFTLTYDMFEPGSTAYLFLDGYAGSVCDFTINVIEGIDTNPVMPPDPALLQDGAITGRNLIACDELNKAITYNLTPPQCEVAYNSACGQSININPADSVCYVWQISPVSGRYFENQDSTGKSLDIVFTEPGTYIISADPYLHPFYGGSCANAACGDVISWKVIVEKPDTITAPVEFVCPGETRNYCGYTITSDSTVFCSSDVCHVIKQGFIFGTTSITDLGTKLICSGGSFDFQGQRYTNPGTYNVADISDCLNVFRFTVDFVNISLQVQSATKVLNCIDKEINVVAQATTNGPLAITFEWKDQGNNSLSSFDDILISKPGKYTVQAIYDKNGIACHNEVDIDITADFKKPAVSVVVPQLRCLRVNEPKPFLRATSPDVLTFFEWTLPAGNKISGMNVELDSTNVSTGIPYQFSAIGTNGCRLDTSFVVKSNFEKAIIQLQGDDLTCYHPKDTLLLSTNISIDSVRWYKTFPSQAFYGSDPTKRSHEITSPGTYKVEVMASSSKCWSNESIDIADRIKYPELALGNPLKWHCNTKEIELIPVSNSNSSFLYNWTTPDGKFISSADQKAVKVGAVGMYQLDILDKDNGCKSSGSITIEEETNVPQNLDFIIDDILCYGESNGVITISGALGGFEPYTYYLNQQKISGTVINGLAQGQYNIEVRDAYDCKFEVTGFVNEPALFIISTPLEVNLEYSESTDFNFTTNYPDNEIMDIIWKDSKGNIIGDDFELKYTASENEIITVEVSTVNGCSSRSEIKVNVDNELKVYFPNIFSPNGDGSNDRFIVFKNKIPAQLNKLSIFDRFGNKVYYENSFEFGDNAPGWDGTFNNKNVETGVYVMIAELIDYTGKKQVIKKSITLIR